MNHTIVRRMVLGPFAVGLVAGLCCAWSMAGEPAVKGYADYAAYATAVRSIGASKFATLESLAKTRRDRDVFLLSISNGKPHEKPALLIVGNVHAPHLLGSELAVRMARRVVEQAATDAEVRKMLDSVTLYFIPRPMPDASEAFFERPFTERAVNDRPMDDDNDGQIDEDGPDDLDGDGSITMMRVKDTTGSYIVHPDDPRVLIEADPKKNETGRWALYVEGRDNDGDGRQNEDPPGGVALNRNFTFEYPYFTSGAGPHQVSEPETRAVADFAFSHPNIVAVFCFTLEDNLMKVWEENEEAEEERIKTTLYSLDVPTAERIAKIYRDIHGGTDAPESPDAEGSFSKWAYFHYGRWSLGCRGWWIPKLESDEAKEESDDEDQEPEADEKKDAEDEEDEDDERGVEELGALAWFEENGIDGFVDWHAVQHPDFPDQEVEVGGFRPFLRLNPPSDRLDELAEKHWEFVRELVAMFPRLTIPPVKAEPLGAGLWRITAAVVNEGRLPTVSQMGQTTGEPHDLQMELTLPRGAKLVTGYARVKVGPLAPEGGRAEQVWLVSVPPGKPATLRVRAWSPSVGSQARSVKLVAKKQGK